MFIPYTHQQFANYTDLLHKTENDLPKPQLINYQTKFQRSESNTITTKRHKLLNLKYGL